MNGRVSQFAQRLEKMILPISRVFNYIGLWIIVLMGLLTVIDVFLRYIFNRPIVGSYEVTELMMVILVFASLGYTMSVKGHVCVDLVTTRLPERIQGIVESVTSLLAFVLFSIVSWRNVLHAATTWQRNDVTAELFISISPFVLFVALGVAVLSLVLLMQFFQSLAKAVQK